MIYYQVILLIALSSFLFDSVEMVSRLRKKRIMFGHQANKKQRDTYPSFRYYVFLSKAKIGVIDEDPSKISDLISWISKFFPREGANLEYHHCGGSLLTPKIVLTACHCLAIFNRISKHDNYTYGWPLNVWEDRVYSYIGSNEASKLYDFLIPRHYVIQQTCRHLEFDLDFITMDFGFIVTKDSVDKKAPKAAISYTPVYKAKDILEFYYSTIQKEFMCLLIGHGYWQLHFRRDVTRGEYAVAVTESSEVQRWGWRTVLNYVDCLSTSYPLFMRRRRPRPSVPFVFFNYTRDNTQVCLKAMTNDGKFNYNFGGGDSGGPVTCNDVFFAVASMSDDNSDDIISFASPIVNTMFINAAEYRDEFIRYCESWGAYNDLYPDIPYPLPTYPDLNPTPPPDVDVHPLSQCSLVTIEHHLFVLSSTLFFTFFT